METSYIIKSRRSIRKFKNKKISADILQEILEAARWAPCAGNLFNTRIIMVEEEDTKQEIAAACLNQGWIASAPILLVFCSEAEKIESVYKERGRLYQVQSTAAAIQNVLLAATDKGIASCWVGAFSDNQVKRAVKIQDEVEVHAVVPLGYRASIPVPVRKLNLSDILHWHEWMGREWKKPKRIMEHIEAIKKKIREKLEKEVKVPQRTVTTRLKPLNFYDLKGKKKFESSTYRIVTKKVKGHKKRFAIAKAPSGIEAWRVLPNK